ncbi:hypothetical protein K8S19_04065 [bacterium]|nr:hypothetical protein [bacterium]
MHGKKRKEIKAYYHGEHRVHGETQRQQSISFRVKITKTILPLLLYPIRAFLMSIRGEFFAFTLLTFPYFAFLRELCVLRGEQHLII